MNRHRQGGSVLIFAVILLSVVSAFSIGTYTLLHRHLDGVRAEHHALQARALAEAGVAEAVQRLRTGTREPFTLDARALGGGHYDVAVTPAFPQRGWHISSVGAYAGNGQVTATCTVRTRVAPTQGNRWVHLAWEESR